MKHLFLLGLVTIMNLYAANAAKLPIPYPAIEAPVVHSGRYHVLTCGKSCVVIDGMKGMSVGMISYAEGSAKRLDASNAVLTDGSIRAVLNVNGESLELDQAYDPAARLEIIDQGPGRVAARSHFSLCSSNGVPHGSGTLDIYLI